MSVFNRITRHVIQRIGFVLFGVIGGVLLFAVGQLGFAGLAVAFVLYLLLSKSSSIELNRQLAELSK
jgi:hypothetical protein